MSILIRLNLKSFNNKLFFNTIEILKSKISTISISSNYIALPNIRKSFCVLRSPHIDKDSREHLSLIRYSGFFNINIQNLDMFIIITQTEIPFGISYNLNILTTNIID